MIKLDEEMISRVNNLSHFDRGTTIQKIANKHYEKFIKTFEDSSYNENQRKTYEKRLEVFKEFLEKSYNEYLNIDSNFVPVTVAGPANYNYKKYNQIAERLANKENEIIEKINKFYKNTENMIKEQIPIEDIIEKYRNGYNEPISSDDPKAKEKLEAKLEYLENKHQKYKDYNKKARQNGEQQLAPYVLANSNQNIKNVKDRLLQLEKMNNLNIPNYYFENGEVCFDKEDNRVKIYFDEKPNEEVRSKLKSHAFKWSPTNMAWQRKLTPDAIYMTKQLFKDIGSLEIKLVQNNVEDKKLKM